MTKNTMNFGRLITTLEILKTIFADCIKISGYLKEFVKIRKNVRITLAKQK
jgi:hypothetical protein